MLGYREAETGKKMYLWLLQPLVFLYWALDIYELEESILNE